jgi:phage baseplate assembly protein gpV
MIETGEVKERKENGVVLVEFSQLGTEGECLVLQPTTGQNNVFVLPSVGTQVVCWLESGKNICLGALFSAEEKAPDGADPDGELRQFGDSELQLKEGAASVKQGEAALELSGGKAGLKNADTDLKTILKEVLKALKGLTVATSMGPSGTPLPPTQQAVSKIEQLVDKLLN